MGSALSKLVTFVAYPIYTYFISPAELGFYDLSITYGTIIGSLFFMDVWVGVMKKFIVGESEERPSIIRAGFIIVGTAVLALAAVTLIISIFLKFDNIWWVFGCIAVGGVRDLWAFVARGMGKTNQFAASGLLSAVVSAVVSVALLQFASWGVEALYIGVISGAVAQALFLDATCHVARSIHGTRSDWTVIKSLLLFALPLAVNSVSYWIFTGLGRIVVSFELGLVENGIFAVASKFGAAIGLLAGVITLVWQQSSFSRTAKDVSFFEKGMALAISVYTVGATLAIPVAAVVFSLIVEDSYRTGAQVVPGFIVVAALAGYSNFVGNIFYAIEKTSVIFISTIVVLLVVAAGTVPLVRVFGIDGANIALVVGYVAGLFVRYRVLSSSAGIVHPWRKELFCGAATVSVWVAGANQLYWVALALAIAIAIGIAVTLKRQFWTRLA